MATLLERRAMNDPCPRCSVHHYHKCRYLELLLSVRQKSAPIGLCAANIVELSLILCRPQAVIKGRACVIGPPFLGGSGKKTGMHFVTQTRTIFFFTSTARQGGEHVVHLSRDAANLY